MYEFDSRWMLQLLFDLQKEVFVEETGKLDTISFSEIKGKYNDSNSFVILALLASKQDKDEIETWLKEIGFLGQNVKILKMFDISGNVKRDGRQDVLFVVDKPEFNPLVRLRTNDIKWTDDFIVNYKQDYFC